MIDADRSLVPRAPKKTQGVVVSRCLHVSATAGRRPRDPRFFFTSFPFAGRGAFSEHRDAPSALCLRAKRGGECVANEPGVAFAVRATTSQPERGTHSSRGRSELWVVARADAFPLSTDSPPRATLSRSPPSVSFLLALPFSRSPSLSLAGKPQRATTAVAAATQEGALFSAPPPGLSLCSSLRSELAPSPCSIVVPSSASRQVVAGEWRRRFFSGS